jgi:hypothetical protein
MIQPSYLGPERNFQSCYRPVIALTGWIARPIPKKNPGSREEQGGCRRSRQQQNQLRLCEKLGFRLVVLLIAEGFRTIAETLHNLGLNP